MTQENSGYCKLLRVIVSKKECHDCDQLVVCKYMKGLKHFDVGDPGVG